MKVTVTQLPNEPGKSESAFAALAEHTKAEGSDLVLLPEMIFSPWLAATDQVDTAQWQASIAAHDEWLSRLSALGAHTVLGTRPSLDKGTPHNDAYIWQAGEDARFAHRKYYLPDEPGFWEATWYQRSAEKRFEAAQAGDAKIGFMICTDIWFTEHARGYARQGVNIIANPRATELSSVEKWIAGGRAAAVMGGAYCLSSNHGGESGGVHWGGGGWIIDPDGNVLGVTSEEQPFLTLEIDLQNAEVAKSSYPRYVKE